MTIIGMVVHGVVLISLTTATQCSRWYLGESGSDHYRYGCAGGRPDLSENCHTMLTVVFGGLTIRQRYGAHGVGRVIGRVSKKWGHIFFSALQK